MSKKKPRKRIKIRGHYYQVRQRSTKKGRKGTIMGKWKPARIETMREKDRKGLKFAKCEECGRSTPYRLKSDRAPTVIQCKRCGNHISIRRLSA